MGGNDGPRDKWFRILREDGFDVDEATGTVRMGRVAPGAKLSEHALKALPDPQSIQDHLHRLADSVDTDPRLAVSTAKALIESTAKCVLTARGQSYTRGAKVPALVNAAQESLGLAPKSVSDEDRALRQALQSLVTLTQSVTELRSGTASASTTEPRRCRNGCARGTPAWSSERPRSGASPCSRRSQTRKRPGVVRRPSTAAALSS